MRRGFYATPFYSALQNNIFVRNPTKRRLIRRKKMIVLVEGNISAGKSTLCAHLGKELDFKLYLEPTATNPLLEKFYKDPKTWALPLQMWVLRQRYFTYVEALRSAASVGIGARGVVLDRSVFSDIVFADKNYRDGNISEEGYEEYMKVRKELLNGLPLPDCCLYLDASPETCYDRMQNLRKRDCEAGVPLDYLEGLHECYRSFLLEMNLLGVDVRSEPWDNFGDVRAVGKRILEGASPERSRASALAQEDIERLLSKLSLFDKFIESDSRISTELIRPEDVSASEAKVMNARRTSSASSSTSAFSSASEGDDSESETSFSSDEGAMRTPLASSCDDAASAAAPSPLGLAEPLLNSEQGGARTKVRASSADAGIPLSLSPLSL